LCGQTSDTIVVNYDYPLNPDLGNDSVVCIRDTLILDPVTNGASCLWQDNSTDTTHQVYKAGKYWMKAVNACGTYSDTVVFAEEYIPQVTLPDDTLICTGESISMDVSFSGCNYRWNTGDTTPNYTINSQGHYAVTITNICGTATDDIHVLYDRPLVVSLGNDTLLCDGDGFYIDLNYPNNPSYLWNTGHASGKIRIQHGGTYTVTVTNRCGRYTGSKRITALYTPELDLGKDTILCYGQVYTIKSGIEHGKTLGIGFNWNNGRDGAAVSVRETGNYWLHAKNICGEGVDSVYVQFNPNPTIAINDTLICPEEELLYDFSRSNHYTIRWISDEEEYTGNFYTVAKPGQYRVVISDSVGCSGQDWFKVEPCPTPLWVPNAFTPNGDPRNNTFKAYKDGLEFFEMKIYDRWNKLVFESNDINDGWDGNYRRDPDQRCAQGMYIWKISFSESENHQLQIKVGEVYLYR
jgi:gliding motility-associated-like protein